jgi:CBS domain-containing protein
LEWFLQGERIPKGGIMRVEQLMSRDVKTCRPDDTCNVAAQIMWENDTGFVPVTADGRKVIAAITDRDVCMAAYTQGRPLHTIPVSSAMAKQIHTCRPSDPLSTAERIMQEHQVRRLPVTDLSGSLVGVISLGDIANHAKRAAGKMGEVTTDEVGETMCAVSRPKRGAAEARL